MTLTNKILKLQILKQNKMKKIILLLVILSISITSNAEPIDDFFTKSDKFFKTFVINNKVDYASLKYNSDLLNETLIIAQTINLENQDAKVFKAFWINSYNLIVIKGIVDKYPVKSALDLKGFFDRNTFKVANQEMTLKQIENFVLKSTFKDPFINFVLVCAANGCPPLLNEAYKPETLDRQLLDRTKLSLNNPEYVKVNDITKTVEVSQIFEWYKEDFIDKERKILDFINKFRDQKIDDNYVIGYYKYDWSLNKLN
jgi:Protein of unknown function, DUF547